MYHPAGAASAAQAVAACPCGAARMPLLPCSPTAGQPALGGGPFGLGQNQIISCGHAWMPAGALHGLWRNKQQQHLPMIHDR